MPTSPRIPPAPLLNALATASSGKLAVKPATKVPTRIERNGASFSALMRMMIDARPSAHAMRRRVSWADHAARVEVRCTEMPLAKWRE
jgi:hypothetical protein